MLKVKDINKPCTTIMQLYAAEVQNGEIVQDAVIVPKGTSGTVLSLVKDEQAPHDYYEMEFKYQEKIIGFTVAVDMAGIYVNIEE